MVFIRITAGLRGVIVTVASQLIELLGVDEDGIRKYATLAVAQFVEHGKPGFRYLPG